MRNWHVFFISLFAGIALIALGFFMGRETGLQEGRENCYADIESVVKAKLPVPSEYKVHDVCFYMRNDLKCSVTYLNDQAIIADGQVLARQPDGTWFYQDQVIQVSVCRRECDVK